VSEPRTADLLFLHAQVAAMLGLPPGVRDVEGLRAALIGAKGATGDDLFTQAAALARALHAARPFLSANAAHAVASAALLLREYDLGLDLPMDDLPALREALARGDETAVADWLRAHSAPLPLP
jgi:prophage maintenance system killer protein